METQTHMEMAHRETQEERTKEVAEDITEEQFLKDLYLFMKKRDTPIERIPHLGFKQIDLFVMFKTVRDLGGYHQVTAQQLWKQVYNKLGGNPRSTSAATCTRRHYEKLLLPYECHVKGILMNALPQHQQKHFHYANYNKDDEDGQRPAKRKLLSIRLHQSPHNLPSDPHGSVFSVPHHYSHYYHPSHVVLPPYVPISSSALTPHAPPAPEPQFAFRPSCPNPADTVRKPLERLRLLAEQYKTSSGLNEPLNLSVKAPSQETNRNPASSFSPPSSSKNPKFLNKPSPLYTPHRSQVVINEGCDTQDVEADGGVTPYSYPAKAGEAYVIDVKAITASSSPTHDSAPTVRTDEGAKATAQKASSPKTDFAVQSNEEREGSPEVRRLSPRHTLPSLPQDNGGKMEIQIPLSMFNSWLRLYGSSAMMQVAEQLHTQEEDSGQRNYSSIDILPTNLSFHRNPQNLSPAPEDLSIRQRKVPSPTPAMQTTATHHSASQNHFTSSKPLPSGGLLKNASIRDVYPVDQQDIMTSYNSKSSNCWDAYDKETRASHIHGKTDSSPLTVQQDFTASKSYNEDAPKGGKERSETGPTAVLMVNSGSASLLHLTPAEVMKLKEIISSSS
ncbi:AT-rich interaction domain 6 [Toxotes jaculatrix]|uniref:AT-rich interaction domain 6 n=1 Tax=Toxotes jaculatrix TaxID=941984 RepID=UPI001B3AB819|nr:AT-rich interaction domain 6 [Toxotes jaculatrix]